MAKCASCGDKVGFMEGWKFSSTLFDSRLFRDAGVASWIGVSSGQLCDRCVLPQGRKIARQVGALSCRMCHLDLDQCVLPMELRDAGLWRRTTTGKLEFLCINCSRAKKSNHIVNAEQWTSTMPEVEIRHPWQDYIDDDPQFWDRLGD